ncbi:MAG: carbohydrate-binding family 9-like protein [Kiritimatiellia bacterium]
MKNVLFFAALAASGLLMPGCASVGSDGKARAPESMRAAYYCPFSETALTVDGELSEPVWAQARTISFFIPVSFKAPVSKTEAKIAYDKNFLYVAFKAYDEDIWSLLTARDSATCNEDVLEIFFKTHPEKDPYFNFEINALSTVLDAYNLKRNAAGNYARWSQWNCAGLKMISKVKGTVNNWTDRDECWILEVAIPFASLPTLGGNPPVKGDKWLFNLARYDYSIYLPEGRELTASAPLSKLDFHRYEDWNALIFN